MASDVTADFNSLCRLCLVQDNCLVPLFTEDCSLLEKISLLSPLLKMSADDGLPTQICHMCCTLLATCYTFKLRCEASDITLREYMKSLKPEKQSVQNDDWTEHSYATERQEDEDSSHLSDSSDKKRSSEKDSNEMDWLDSVNCLLSDERDVNKPSDESHSVKSSQEESQDNSNTYLVEVHSEDSQEQVQGTFICEDCSTTFSSEEELVNHSCTGVVEKTFSCSECGKCFLQNSLLEAHMKTHSEANALICVQCGKRFSKLSNLKEHLKSHNEKETSFLCPKCGESFSHKRLLLLHLRKLSCVEKPYACTECGKSFEDQKFLKMHMISHSEGIPYICIHCGKCFSNIEVFKAHMRNHSFDKQYACNKCGERFFTEVNLRSHMRSHESKLIPKPGKRNGSSEGNIKVKQVKMRIDDKPRHVHNK